MALVYMLVSILMNRKGCINLIIIRVKRRRSPREIVFPMRKLPPYQYRATVARL
jgi:hypothetical protein